VESTQRFTLPRATAVISVALLLMSPSAANAQVSHFPRPFVVLPRESPADVSIRSTPALAGLERFCRNQKCVVLPRTEAESESLRSLAATGRVALEPFDDARRIYFAKATYDVDRRAFDRDFAGRAEIAPASPVGQWAIVFKSFLEPAWEKEILQAGLFLGDSLGPVAYQLYGPSDALENLRSRVRYIADVVTIPHGIKRFRVDEPLPGDEDGGPVPTTVAILAVDESPARALLEKREGDRLPLVYTSRRTFAVRATLTRDEALYLSSFPDVVAVMRETDRAVPSDERSNRVIAGTFQSPDSSWPLTLGANTTGTSWNSYLASLGAMGIHPANQTIAFLDTGVGSAPLLNCPPALVDPEDSSNCSLTLGFDPVTGDEFRSITDIVEEFGDPTRRANDYVGHGTLTTAIAAGYSPLGFTASQGGRDAQKYSYPQGVAPGAKIAMSRAIQRLACLPPTTPIGMREFRRFRNEPGGGYMYQDNLALEYSLVTLSQPVGTVAPDGAIGAGATLFNHSWNRPLDSNYGPLDLIMDKSARGLNYVDFDFGPLGTADLVYGAASPATHIVSAGNTAPGEVNPTMVTTPATAKNVITIGATESYNQLATSLPTGCRAGAQDDVNCPRQLSVLSRFGYPNFRLKPDFLAPGNLVAGPRSEVFYTSSSCPDSMTCISTAPGGPPTYLFASGTSFAAPVATGVVALLREWFAVLGKDEPSPAMVRATMIVGAQNLVTSRDGAGNCFNVAGGQWTCGDMRPAPDQYQGWGGVSLDRYFRAASKYFFYDQEVVLCQECTGAGSTPWTTTVTIDDPTKPVRIALAWTDAAGSTALAPEHNLRNDLDLEVSTTGSDGIPHVWYGNLFYLNRDDLARREWSLRDPASVTRDRKNNHEKIAIAKAGETNGLPAGATTLTIRVSAFNISENGLIPDDAERRQDFAIAVENAH
jgi:subtilisin family serine protease